MNLVHLLAIIYAGTGLLITGLAIPLIRRRVPPNGIYGVRTKASFASESDWYRINAIGGRYLAVSGFFIFLIGVVGFFLPASSRDPYSIGAGVATLLSILIPCVRLSLLKASVSPGDRQSLDVRAISKPSE